MSEWQTYSGNGGCVEFQRQLDGSMLVRDTKDRTGPYLQFTGHEWSVFTDGIRAPRRGDAVAEWLKAGRDQYPPESNHYMAMDLLLDDYRLHADTGTPLDRHACDGVCDCEGGVA